MLLPFLLCLGLLLPALAQPEEHLWQAHVISLNPSTSPRFQAFAQRNAHLPFTVFPGVLGKALNRTQLLADGVISPELLAPTSATPGMLGCAMSHRALWERCVEAQVPFLILEDDTATHWEIVRYIEVHWEALNALQYLKFGVNTDSVMYAQTPEGLNQTSMWLLKYPPYDQIDQWLAKTQLRDVRRHRLIYSFGNLAYWVTPQGAKLLLERTFPLSAKTTDIQGYFKIAGISLDRRLQAVFGTMDAYVTVPFLAYSPNDDSATESFIKKN